MSVLLLEPLVEPAARWGRLRAARGFVPPMGMISLYSYLKAKGKDVLFLDTQFGAVAARDILHLLMDRRADIHVVGIPVLTSTARHSFETARLCKEARPDVAVVLGGVHATALPERSLAECPSADFVVLGEGERTLDELVERLGRGAPVEDVRGLCFRSGDSIVRTPARPPIAALDELPRLRYEDIDLARYVPHPTQYKVLPNFPLVTQRGCPYPCTFCGASLVHGKRVRRFSTDRVIDDLEILQGKHGARGVYFQDSTFTMDRDWVLDLSEKMIRKDLGLQWACNTRCDRVDLELLRVMKRAGCWMINYGVESANQESLDLLGKRMTVEQNERGLADTRKAEIATTCNFILCLPCEDERMVENTIRFARRVRPDMALFWFPVPYPGTELLEICRREGSLREDATWEEYGALDLDNPVYVHPILGKAGMQRLHRRAYRSFYLDPRYLAKMALGIRSWEDLRRRLRGFHAIWNAFVREKPSAEARADRPGR